MQVKALENELLVGTATLEHLDPSMGVAFGPFSPAPDYALNAHANVIEGEYVGDTGIELAATIDHQGALIASIAIED
jgi:hypothetical protein